MCGLQVCNFLDLCGIHSLLRHQQSLHWHVILSALVQIYLAGSRIRRLSSVLKLLDKNFLYSRVFLWCATLIPFYILEYRMILCSWYVSVTKSTLMLFGLAAVWRFAHLSNGVRDMGESLKQFLTINNMYNSQQTLVSLWTYAPLQCGVVIWLVHFHWCSICWSMVPDQVGMALILHTQFILHGDDYLLALDVKAFNFSRLVGAHGLASLLIYPEQSCFKFHVCRLRVNHWLFLLKHVYIRTLE